MVQRSKPVREFKKRGRVNDPAVKPLLAPEQHHREPRQLPGAKQHHRESLADVALRLGIPRRTAQAWLDGHRAGIAPWIGREMQAWSERSR
jgi:hypothetical protein